MSLKRILPKRSGIVNVYYNDRDILEQKTYSAYDSSTRECRIGGMREFFEKNRIKSGDEVVIQVIDQERFIYRLIPENRFIIKGQELQQELDFSKNEKEASGRINTLAQWINLDREIIILSEYRRLINTMPFIKRRHSIKTSEISKERIPINLRILLEELYKGHCQVCDFSFLKIDGRPYFETHHLNPQYANHPKNIIVLCGNCHNQFEYANVTEYFNKEQWLIKVSFNEIIYNVNQIILQKKLEDSFKELHMNDVL